jgi:glucokinase
MNPPTVIGIDLGGTKVASALFDGEGNILLREHLYLEGRGGKEAGRLILEVIRRIMEKAEKRRLPVAAAGIGVPGIYYGRTGTVWAPNIPGWEAFPLREEITSSLKGSGVAVRIDSDRACYILGEAWRGAAAGCRDAIFLAVGTGIGAGILVEGRILRGASDIAGAVGWMVLGESSIPYDPASGHFESHASGAGIATVAHHLMTPKSEITAQSVFDAFHAGDAGAKAVIGIAVRFWGRAVANLVSIFNPEKIIFGGGVFGPAAALLEDIRTEALKWGQPISMQEVELEVSQLGGDAGLYGAGYLALKRSRKSEVGNRKSET